MPTLHTPWTKPKWRMITRAKKDPKCISFSSAHNRKKNDRNFLSKVCEIRKDWSWVYKKLTRQIRGEEKKSIPRRNKYGIIIILSSFHFHPSFQIRIYIFPEICLHWHGRRIFHALFGGYIDLARAFVRSSCGQTMMLSSLLQRRKEVFFTPVTPGL